MQSLELEERMQRRSFVNIAAGIGGILGTSQVFKPKILLGVGVSDFLKGKTAGNLFYTKEAPGKWSKKVRAHIPIIEKSGNTVQVTTKHKSVDWDHYIVKHVIYDEKFEYLDEVMFKPDKTKWKKTTYSEFKLDEVPDVFFVMSYCNKHDGWIEVYGA